MSQKPNYLLAIESAIAGGSIALFRGPELIGSSHGSAGVSRAEDLLPNINELLIASNVSKSEIASVAVSLGPGSYTGLRIGIATVLGLCRGLEIGHVGVDLFDAIAKTFAAEDRVIALPMGRSDVCIRPVNKGSEPKVIEAANIEAELTAFGKPLLIHSQLNERLSPLGVDLIDIGTDLAKYVGLAAMDMQPSVELRPIYLQNPRFG